MFWIKSSSICPSIVISAALSVITSVSVFLSLSISLYLSLSPLSPPPSLSLSLSHTFFWRLYQPKVYMAMQSLNFIWSSQCSQKTLPKLLWWVPFHYFIGWEGVLLTLLAAAAVAILFFCTCNVSDLFMQTTTSAAQNRKFCIKPLFTDLSSLICLQRFVFTDLSPLICL